VDKLYHHNPARLLLIAWRGRARGAGGSVLDVARLDAWIFAQLVTWRLKWRTWKRLSGLAAYMLLSSRRQAEVQSLALSAMAAGRWPLIATHVFRRILPVVLRGLTEEVTDILCYTVGRSDVVEEMGRVPSFIRPDSVAGDDDHEVVADPFERARRKASSASTSVFMLGTQTVSRVSAGAANIRSDKLFLSLTSSYFRAISATGLVLPRTPSSALRTWRMTFSFHRARRRMPTFQWHPVSRPFRSPCEWEFPPMKPIPQ
jgi:hypothetical protein